MVVHICDPSTREAEVTVRGSASAAWLMGANLDNIDVQTRKQANSKSKRMLSSIVGRYYLKANIAHAMAQGERSLS